MEEIKSKSEIPSWFKLDNYIQNISMSLRDFELNISIRIIVIDDYLKSSGKSLKEKFTTLKDELIFTSYIDEIKKNPIYFYNKQKPFFNEELLINKRLKNSGLIFSGVKPANIDTINRLENKFKTLKNNELSIYELPPYKKLNNNEKKLFKTWKEYNKGTNSNDDAWHDDLLYKIQNLHNLNIRDLHYDFLCDLFNHKDDKSVLLEIDLNVPDLILIKQFNQLLKALRKKRHLSSSHDKTISVTKIGESQSEKNFNKLINFRVLEFFDLSYWARMENKKIPNEIMANILFPNTPANKNPEGILKSTIKFANKFFSYEFLKNLQNQVRTNKNYIKTPD